MARPRLPRNVIALGLVSLFTDLSSEMIYPLLPIFLTVTLGAGPAVLGIGKGVRSAPLDALIAASVPADDRGRAFGLQRAMDHLGAVLGPGVAFLLLAGAGLSYRSVFFLAAVPGAAAGARALVLAPGPGTPPPRGSPPTAGAGST